MRILVILFALAMPVVSYIWQRAAFGPDNKTISDQHPTLLIASGYAFSIWGLIFLWDLAFGVWQLVRDPQRDATMRRVRPLAAAGFALTAAWMPVFSLRLFWLSLAIIWASFACMASAAVILSRGRHRSRETSWLAWVPLSLHAGWLSLAAFLHTAQVIVAYRLLPVDAMLTWSLVLFALAAALLLALDATMRGNVPFAVAAFWGLIAVYVKQSSAPLPGASTAAWVALAIAAVLVVDVVYRRMRLGAR